MSRSSNAKTAGINGARLWKDGVPEYVQLQVHHQLAVTGKEAAQMLPYYSVVSIWRSIALCVTKD